MLECCAEGKRLAGSAWAQLHASAGGGPELGGAALCQQCLQGALQQVVDADEQGARNQTMMTLLSALDAMDGSCAEGFYVSKTWLAYGPFFQLLITELSQYSWLPLTSSVCRPPSSTHSHVCEWQEQLITLCLVDECESVSQVCTALWAA